MSGSGGDLNNSQYVQGGTDDTLIGNVGDRLKVDANFTTPPTVAEQELATFISYSASTAPGNNKSMLSLLNASGSGFRVKIREIRIVNVQTTAVTGVVCTFEALRFTGHTGGTLITEANHDTSDTKDADITTRTGSTISGETTPYLRRWIFSTDEWGVGAQDVESWQHGLQVFNSLYNQPPKTKPITLQQGEGLHIKCATNTTVGSFDVLMLWTQEAV